MQVVEEEYSRKLHVRQGIEMSLGFDGEVIRLSIPRSGEILESGWKIMPLYDPIVSYSTYLLCVANMAVLVLVSSCNCKWKLLVTLACSLHRLGNRMWIVSVMVR